jgi:phosphopantetheine--protein transferase-like protein
MTLVAYTKIQHDASVDQLLERVESAFPNVENREYFDKIKSRKNQDSIKESLCALLVLAELIKRAHCCSEDLIFSRQESGKPYFSNSPIEFSLSHSHGYAAAAISDSSRVGIDVETAQISAEKAEKLAQRFFSEAEIKEFQAAPQSFLKIWTKKEALAKMLGTPLSELIAYEKSSPASPRKAADFHCLSADGHPLTVCLEKLDEIKSLGEIII